MRVNTTSFTIFCCLIFPPLIFVNCIRFGYVSPIEVVEEWGCHNTEIRLTCGHLDSSIAILEATFTPNCSQILDDKNNCAHIDLKRLTRAYSSPLIDHQMAETEAGRKFLETLRRSKEIEAAMNESLATTNNKIDDLKHYSYIELKLKRNSLRASLEELILEYLSGLSPPADDEENYLEFSKRIRKKREIYVYEENKLENKSDKLGLESDSVFQRTEIGAMNITVMSEDYDDSDSKYDRYKSVSERSACLDHKRRITQLDQFILDKSIENEADDEHNIRRILNYRCSGKNHCSFLFSIDHPFSMLWDSGIVRVKYICMEDFRLNKFCGEHLLIGVEKDAEDEYNEKSYPIEQKREPIAQARIQSDQKLHHVKILTANQNNESPAPIDSIVAKDKDKIKRKNHRVYSQDFRILKILPSNVDDINDIEKIGNEIYFKKYENEIDDDDRTPYSAINERTTESTNVGLDENNVAENDILEVESNNWELVRPPNLFSAVSSTQTEPSRVSQSTHQNQLEFGTTPNYYENILPENVTFRETLEKLENEISNEIIVQRNDSSQKQPPIFSEKLNDENLVSTRKTIEDGGLREKQTTLINKKIYYKQNSVIKSNDLLDDYEDEADYSYEDFAVEYNGRTVIRRNKIRNHTSHQFAVFKRPLLQGFLATTGYPKFYIGESNCSWRISAPIGQRVRIIILDINLRYDFICKDFIQIFDLEIGRMIFNSCSEHNRPIQVLSDSNHIVIYVNTTSKVAYPKRGVLLHYAALGCLTPSDPLHGRLVHKTENSAKYICDPSFVFPDTAVSSRELFCTSSHTWDKILPNCVDKAEVRKSGIITIPQFDHKKKSTKMTEKDDLLNNIIIPSSVIAILFIVNAMVFLAIMRCRQRKRGLDFDQHELAQL